MRLCDVLVDMFKREAVDQPQQSYRRLGWHDADKRIAFDGKIIIVNTSDPYYSPTDQDLTESDWYVIVDPPEQDPWPGSDDLVCLVKQELTTKVKSGGCTVDDLLHILIVLDHIE